MLPYAKPQDQYLAQKVLGASPEGLVALLLEGGQRFLGQAIQAIQRNDIPERARLVGRVLAITDELLARLDHENGSELVGNLVNIYDWWNHEIVEGSTTSDVVRLERVIRQMGELKETWEDLDRRQKAERHAQPQAFSQAASVGLVG